ncbi:MAG: response regulator [Acidobacteriota bacterium]|nr:response regulator [Acidobacteriota bacterium]
MSENAQRRREKDGQGSGHILLVEDDRVDAMAVERAFRELDIEDRLEVVADGQEALEHLELASDKVPDLILLDLNMPRMSGVEFLFARQSHEVLRRIPVVVMTTSTDEKDRVSSFDLGVAGYIVKPVDYHQFVDEIRSLQRFRHTGRWHA